MNEAKHDLGKAADDISTSVEDLRRKIESWGKEESQRESSVR
jgi:hypothetical protein